MTSNGKEKVCGNCGLKLDGNFLCFCNPQVNIRMEIIGLLYQEDRAEEREAKRFIKQLTYWTFLVMFAVPLLDFSGVDYVLWGVMIFYVFLWLFFGPRSLLTIEKCKKYREKFFDEKCKLLRKSENFNPLGKGEFSKSCLFDFRGEESKPKKSEEEKQQQSKEEKQKNYPHFYFYFPMLLVVIGAFLVALFFSC